jgi:hypothetical protein
LSKSRHRIRHPDRQDVSYSASFIGRPILHTSINFFGADHSHNAPDPRRAGHSSIKLGSSRSSSFAPNSSNTSTSQNTKHFTSHTLAPPQPPNSPPSSTMSSDSASEGPSPKRARPRARRTPNQRGPVVIATSPPVPASRTTSLLISHHRGVTPATIELEPWKFTATSAFFHVEYTLTVTWPQHMFDAEFRNHRKVKGSLMVDAGMTTLPSCEDCREGNTTCTLSLVSINTLSFEPPRSPLPRRPSTPASFPRIPSPLAFAPSSPITFEPMGSAPDIYVPRLIYSGDFPDDYDQEVPRFVWPSVPSQRPSSTWVAAEHEDENYLGAMDES